MLLSRHCGRTLFAWPTGMEIIYCESHGARLYKLQEVLEKIATYRRYSCSTYCAREIIDQIIYVLDADTKPNYVLGHLSLSSGFRIDTGMAHAARHADQAVHAA